VKAVLGAIIEANEDEVEDVDGGMTLGTEAVTVNATTEIDEMTDLHRGPFGMRGVVEVVDEIGCGMVTPQGGHLPLRFPELGHHPTFPVKEMARQV
jgi:hypothetical protein